MSMGESGDRNKERDRNDTTVATFLTYIWLIRIYGDANKDMNERKEENG